MSDIEKQLGAIMRCLAAETEEDRERARVELREMVGIKPAPAASVSVEDVIADILLDLGVPCHLKGCPHLITAIAAVAKDAQMINAVTSMLYPFVAEKHETTPSRVERAIRHAIECGWDRADLDVLSHYFGNTVSSSKGKPTNSEFISRVANVVRLRMREVA